MTLMQILGTIFTAAFTGYVTFRVQEERLKKELKTEFMAEQVVNRLLNDEKWQKRSFEEIKKRLGGFEDDELRKLLVRSGAVRFEKSGGSELWGLIERNKKDI